MSEWQPIETAPHQKVIWVRNKIMEKPVLATRGYASDRGVHPDPTFCTTVFTNDRYFPVPPGRLVCPTEWKPSEDGDHLDVEAADRAAGT